MRRLSLSDVGLGHPRERGRLGPVVYKRDIYNFRDVLTELEARATASRPDRPRSSSTRTRVGDDCVERFQGMFTFALWTRGVTVSSSRGIASASQLFLTCGGQLLFGSESRPLAHPAVERRLRPAPALQPHLTFLYLPEPLTMSRASRAPRRLRLTAERGRVRFARTGSSATTSTRGWRRLRRARAAGTADNAVTIACFRRPLAHSFRGASTPAPSSVMRSTPGQVNTFSSATRTGCERRRSESPRVPRAPGPPREFR